MGTNGHRLTQKQEKFVLYIFSGMTQREAWIQAGYSSNYPMKVVDSNACNLFHTNKVQARYRELQDKIVSDKIMTVTQRLERLSEIASARLTDYQESGQDGGWINIGKESPNTAALSEIVSTTKYDDNGANPTLITRIKLHNPIQAIDLLNKMDKLYAEGTTVNVDNRKIEITVTSETARHLLTEIAEGIPPHAIENQG